MAASAEVLSPTDVPAVLPAPLESAATDGSASSSSSSSLVWPPTHRYKDAAKALVETFKCEALQPNVPENGWTPLAQQNGVVVTKKPSAVPLGVLRGDGVIEGFSTYEVFAVATTTPCRLVWDEMYEDGKAIEVLDASTTLSYAASKGQFPVSGRDFCVVLLTEFLADGRIFSMSASVNDPQVPEVRSKVRGTLKMNGWYLEPINANRSTRVVYISEVDINGSVPGAILKMAASKMPMVVADVRNYLNKHGPPPMLLRVAGHTSASTFSHGTSEYKVEIKVDTSKSDTTELLLCKQRYPSGCKVDISPYDNVTATMNPDKSVVVLKHTAAASGTLTIKVAPSLNGSMALFGDGQDLAAPAGPSTPPEAVSATRTTSLTWPPKHRFASTAQALVTKFKEMAHKEATKDNGWVEINRAKDVVVTKQSSDVPLGILRGDGIIKGYNPFEVYAVCAFPSCRKVWDELFEEGRPVENLDESTILSYAATKGQFPVSGRDLCVILVNEFCLDGRIYSMTASVQDEKVQPVRGKVRANLKLNGWYLEPLTEEKGTRVVYISEIDLNGSIPGAILSIVAQKMPLVVADVRKYLMRNGPPPFFNRIGATIVTTPDFDHTASTFETRVKLDSSISPFTSILLSKQRYPTGCSVQLTPEDCARLEVPSDGASLVLHHDDASKNGTEVRIQVRPLANGRPGEVRVNGSPVSTATTGAVVPATTTAVATTTTISPVPPTSPLSEWIEILPEQLGRIEQAMEDLQASKDYSPRTQSLGLAFLAGIPLVAMLAARVWV